MHRRSVDRRHSFRAANRAGILLVKKRGATMTKLQTIFAGVALGLFAQFAAAQSTGVTAPSSSDPAYTDQSRLNQSSDPYVKKRVTTKEAKDEYKADKKAAKAEYKEEKKAAKSEYKAEKKDAKETRKAELADPANRPANPELGTPTTGK
jgi:hypothetical protein